MKISRLVRSALFVSALVVPAIASADEEDKPITEENPFVVEEVDSSPDAMSWQELMEREAHLPEGFQLDPETYRVEEAE